MESSEGFGEKIRKGVQKRVAKIWGKDELGATSVQILRQSLAEVNQRLADLQDREQQLQREVAELRTSNERLQSKRQGTETLKNWYRAMFQEVPMGYLVTDIEGKVREANLVAGRLIGVSAELLKEKPFWSLVAEEERDTVQSMLDRVRRGQTVTRWIARVRPPQGAEARACAWTMSPLHTAEGFAILFEEVSEVLLERDALRRRAALLDNAQDVVIELARDGTLVDWNRAAEALYRCPSEEAAGLPLDALIPDDEYLTLQPLLARMLEGEPAGSIETTHVGDNGRARYMEWSLAPLRDEDGRPDGGAARAKDVTARHLEDERQNRERLRIRSLVAERALADERTRRRVAHELELGLQQSLNLARMKLAGLSQIIGGCSLDEPVQAACGLIDEALGSMEAAAFALSPPVLHDLGFVAGVRWLGDDMRKNHGLTVHVEDDGRDKRLDEAQRVLLFQALRELLLNVAQHARTEAARLQMHVDGDRLVLRVRDEGEGYDGAVIEEGPGLLATREQLAHLGGRLDIRTAPGKGTTATIMVPLPTLDRGLEREAT